MTSQTVRRVGALLVTGTLLGSLMVASVAAPASAAKPRCDGKVATIVSSKAVIRGTNKADVIVARGTTDNTIYGKGGNDRICAGAGRDRVVGGDGADRLFGGGGRDRVIGGNGADVLQGGKGPDTLEGGDGPDRLFGGPGQDACDGGAGIDRLFSCNEPATSGELRITTDTTLTAPHKGGISIDADGVRLDCAGHTITGPGSGRGIEVLGRQGVTIFNCHATNFGSGISVWGSSGVLIRRSSANGNMEWGISVGGSDAAILTANVANKNGESGFFLNLLTNARVVGNVADYTRRRSGFAVSNTRDSWFESNLSRWSREASFSIFESQDNTFRSNRGKGRGRDFGFLFMGPSSTGNLLQGNTVTDHSVGFGTNDSVGNTYRGNTARDNGLGFEDGTSGSGTKGTANTYANNRCVGNAVASEPRGLCR